MTAMSKVEAAFCRSAPWRGFARRIVLPWALQDSVLGKNVLEIGGGSGAMAYELLDREPGIALTVTDIDPSMVAAGTRRLEPFAERANVIHGDASRLDIADSQFDTVCTWLMLHHTIAWPEVLAEAARVLRPGGTLIGYDLTNSTPARLVHRIDRSKHRMIDPDGFETELRRQGFTAVAVEPALAGLVMRFKATSPR